MFGFSWVIAGKLAGMGHPGFWAADLPTDLAALKTAGVGALVSLTEAPLDAEVLAASGLEGLHLPIPDMTPPTMDDVDRFAAFVENAISDGRPVAVHCLAGRGRTGTMLACYLVKQGADPDAAVLRVRQLRPGSIETWEQELAVHAYARHLLETG